MSIVIAKYIIFNYDTVLRSKNHGVGNQKIWNHLLKYARVCVSNFHASGIGIDVDIYSRKLLTGISDNADFDHSPILFLLGP